MRGCPRKCEGQGETWWPGPPVSELAGGWEGPGPVGRERPGRRRERERGGAARASPRPPWPGLAEAQGPRPLGRGRGCGPEARGAGGAVGARCCAWGWGCALDAGQGCFRPTAVRVLGCGGGMANVRVAVRVRPLSKR